MVIKEGYFWKDSSITLHEQKVVWTSGNNVLEPELRVFQLGAHQKHQRA